MILNTDELRIRAHEFALTQELSATNKLASSFWPEFKADMASLHEFAEHLQTNKVECKQPAEDWLLDHINFVETQAQVVFRELPRATLKKLPKTRNTSMPRIYELCSDYLEHVGGRYDIHSFESYLHSYQEVTVLKDAECWALLSAMRVIIIRRLAAAMSEVRQRHKVCHDVTSLLGQIGGPKNMTDAKIRALLARETDKKQLGPIEIVHFIQHLNEWEPNIQAVHDWLAAHIENSEASIEQMISLEHHLQAELQVTCGYLVQSLHILERVPWRLTFTKISHIEKILQTDPQEEFKQLDLASKDLLRFNVAKIAHQLKVPESLVAKTAIKIAVSRQKDTESKPRDACLSYYLLDPNGNVALRKELSHSARPRMLPALDVRRRPSLVYIMGLVILFAGLMLLAGNWVTYGAPHPVFSWIAIFAALILPVSDWVIMIAHELISKCCKPVILVRYDFSKRLPEEARTIVVMPIIWSSTEEVDDVVDRLLVHYYANRQENIHFGILADFHDAAEETLPQDQEILTYAVKRIQALQKKFGEEKFFLFHRSRLYNSKDRIYMGWERKRGKLVEFVELLSGCENTSYTTIVGKKSLLKNIRYVFTTDHDTQLPIGVVSRLAGTIHFPYNRPRFNDERTRVVEGHGILQPRIGVSIESTQKSSYAKLCAGEPGIDPYAFAISDAYQDLFGHGIFVGKGIFDVEAFQKTLVNRIPEHQVLSHDLLEGGFLRAGLATDIEVVEAYPSTYYAHERRLHRWIRGDWQLIKWLGRSCRDRFGEKQKIALCGLTRWQIIDNLRRSLMAPALLLIALLGLNILPGRRSVWETIVLLTLFLPFFRAIMAAILSLKINRTMLVTFLQSVIHLLTLPFSAVLSMDAIIRTLYRLFISRRNMLEWVPSAEMDRHSTKVRVFMFEIMGYISVLLFFFLAFFFGGIFAKVTAAVALIIWVSAHPVINSLNQPKEAVKRPWLNGARPELKDIALKIWSFYERYVTEEESWLPPDNVQYHPKEIIAHRTSPTNIGLYLACVTAARDLEFINTPEMLQRIESSLKTIAKMEKWNGHLLNWYDTCSAKPLFPKYVSTVDSGNLVAYLMVVRQGLLEWGERETENQERIGRLAGEIDELIEETNFMALFNANERLLSLGYNIDSDKKDTTLYDLLASESRQASFVAIALGQIPASHWFSLGRTMTISGKKMTLLSWSGTMFEYLMPSLIMRTYQNTIWDSTYQGVIHKQTYYADTYQIPFGISESGYYAFDYQLNYQYRAFGVPGLGLDRGLEKNLVIAPYATIMALPFAGEAALAALHRFADYQAKGEFGYYEAVDFTTGRMPNGTQYQIVKSYMAHHQGMSMLTLLNLLENDKLVNRFHADARVCAADLLLQERIPEKAALIEDPIGLNAKFTSIDEELNNIEQTFTEPTLIPEVNVLSNSRLMSVNTNKGTGLLTWKGISITSWREDPVVNTSGTMIYIHEVSSEETWSVAKFPCQTIQDTKTVFRLDKTIFEGNYRGISAKMEITVSPDIDAEVRRLKLVNNSDKERILEVTSYLELALANPAAVNAHPAFSKLFIETSHDSETQSLLAKKRKREEEQELWAVHTVYAEGEGTAMGDYEFETDRAKFISRGYTIESPKAIFSRLRGLTGSVVDPAFIMRRRIHLAPQETAAVYVVTGAAESRENALEIIHKLRDPKQASRSFHMAWVRSQIDIRHLHLTSVQASAAHMLAGRLLAPPPLMPSRREAIVKNSLGQSALWSKGISGDVPIVMVKVNHLADLSFVVLLVRQHQYLVMLGLDLDLVILDETTGSYQELLMNRLSDQLAARGIGQTRRIVNLKAEQLTEAECVLLHAVSRVTLRAGGPSLKSQLRMDGTELKALKRKPDIIRKVTQQAQNARTAAEGEFFNGWGGFTENGQSYQMNVQKGAYLPRPWSNILSNQHFGTLITDFGTGYTWWRNSREYKLSPWSNDPVLDQPGECLYLRDLDTNQVWSGTPKPAGDELSYKVTHGKGYSRFEQETLEIAHSMELTVPLEDSIKLMTIRLQNNGECSKRIALTYYVEWVLGVAREAQAPYIVTEWDVENKALLACNTYQETFRDAISFLTITNDEDNRELSYSWTGDRAEFIGIGGTLAQPSALAEKSLSNRTGAFSNTCGALQTIFELGAGETKTCTILLGCASSKDEVFSLISKYSQADAYEDTILTVKNYWQELLGKIQIKTPDRAMDIMMNGWLLYQTLACRLWARTAFYQAGGAFGFRDQLQDSLAFLHADPSITRKQILINAAHQYKEGDVQHWWHEETHKGIRTKFSDDLLWLPYTVSRYVEQTKDMEILSEVVPFLQSENLSGDELERYEDTIVSEESGTLLEHCLRAIRHALKYGEHGIPLMGIGDWNDGMSRIGAKGRGESVWLGWFLVDNLKRFTKLKSGLLSSVIIDQFEQSIREIERNLNHYAWDGAWFRRAFTDAGDWIGTASSKECRIDAIAQSWSVISQGTAAERQIRAMYSFDRELVDRDLDLARLLTKPFNESKPSPGYIQGYPPGIRENGGQYTHGVIWGIVAWAMLERKDKAFELFSMLNPITHTLTFRDVQTYENEPYVMSADVYTASPHEGRGGWSWYTGAAGWMYQAGLEYILGLKLQGDLLSIQPCVPSDWKSFHVDYRYGKSKYSFTVYCQQDHGVPVKWLVDGRDAGNEPYLQLADDGKEHQVEVHLGLQRSSTVG